MSSPVHTVQKICQFYESGYQDRFLDAALDKIVARQIERDKADLARVEAVLAQFEHDHGMETDRFHRMYQAGELPDAAEMVEWNAFWKMRQRLAERLSILRGDAVSD